MTIILLSSSNSNERFHSSLPSITVAEQVNGSNSELLILDPLCRFLFLIILIIIIVP